MAKSKRPRSGYRFGISQASVSRYIHKWVNILHARLLILIHWPEYPDLMKIIPNNFQKYFKKCILVIDCLEVFIEQLTSLLVRAQTYKKHNTINFLIGITPVAQIIANFGFNLM